MKMMMKNDEQKDCTINKYWFIEKSIRERNLNRKSIRKCKRPKTLNKTCFTD